jgi:hypothetical protein
LRHFSQDQTVVNPSNIEIIGPEAFRASQQITDLVFESGTKLREIGENAFFRCRELTSLIVPKSVEILGDGCFWWADGMATITFEAPSKLKTIGAFALAVTMLNSITIPASTEEIDGSAFHECPLESIQVAPGNRSFIVEGQMLLTLDGAKIVKYFGKERKIVVPIKVEVLGRSCFFESCHLESIVFENGSKLRRICHSALAFCGSLTNIEIPATVEVIEESAFNGCDALEHCSIAANAVLVSIEKEAFMNCHSLRSFDVPRRVKGIGQNCFQNCGAIHRLGFGSGESVKNLIGDLALDEWLEHLGLNDISSLFRIEVSEFSDSEGGGGGRGADLEFPGWTSVVDESSHLTLVRPI